MMNKLITLLLTFSLSGVVFAVPDGNHLLNHCIHYINFADTDDVNYLKKHAYSVPYCQGFIDSSRETLSQMRAFVEDDDFKTCIPSETQNSQLARIVVLYLKKRPKFLHKSAGLLTMIALKDAYPCKKGK